MSLLAVHPSITEGVDYACHRVRIEMVRIPKIRQHADLILDPYIIGIHLQYTTRG